MAYGGGRHITAHSSSRGQCARARSRPIWESAPCAPCAVPHPPLAFSLARFPLLSHATNQSATPTRAEIAKALAQVLGHHLHQCEKLLCHGHNVPVLTPCHLRG